MPWGAEPLLPLKLLLAWYTRENLAPPYLLFQSELKFNVTVYWRTYLLEHAQRRGIPSVYSSFASLPLSFPLLSTLSCSLSHLTFLFPPPPYHRSTAPYIESSPPLLPLNQYSAPYIHFLPLPLTLPSSFVPLPSPLAPSPSNVFHLFPLPLPHLFFLSYVHSLIRSTLTPICLSSSVHSLF